jgi:hypothetical protein
MASAAAKPLQFKWSFWENRISNQKSMQTQDWKNLQQHLCSFNNTEDFWHYYGGLPKPSAVFYDGKERMRRRVGKEGEERIIESFALFKNGIEPSWEDDGNIRGGEWWIRRQVQPGMLDRWWENLVRLAMLFMLLFEAPPPHTLTHKPLNRSSAQVLGLVGCTIENGDDIAGARVVDKSKVGDGRTIV